MTTKLTDKPISASRIKAFENAFEMQEITIRKLQRTCRQMFAAFMLMFCLVILQALEVI